MSMQLHNPSNMVAEQDELVPAAGGAPGETAQLASDRLKKLEDNVSRIHEASTRLAERTGGALAGLVCTASQAVHACIFDELRELFGNRTRQRGAKTIGRTVHRVHAKQGQTPVTGQVVQEETRLFDVVGHPGRTWGQALWKCTQRRGDGVSCHPWVQQLRADMKALWALSPTAWQSLPSPEEPGCEGSWLAAAEDERKWRAPVGSLYFVESTIDKKGEESRVKSHPVVCLWTCGECGRAFHL